MKKIKIFAEDIKTADISYFDYAKNKIDNYKDYPICKVGNKIVDLREKIEKDKEVEFLDISYKWGNRTYTKTLSLVFAMALNRLYPQIEADLNHYIGAGLYIDFANRQGLRIEEIEKIKKEMDDIIAANYEIKTYTVSKNEAIEIFKDKNPEIIRLLSTIEEDIDVGICQCQELIDINYSILAPTTGYISSYKLMNYYPGLLLISPNIKNNFDASNYKEMPKLAKVFQDSTDHYKLLGLNKLADINEKILSGQAKKIMQISDAIFTKKIMDIASKIHNDKDIKMVLISGPTSSGKTTFTGKLKIYLEALGYSTIMISMDDYFVDREKTPLDKNGEFDFESPYAVDLDLFNKDMYRLLNQEKIYKREFDFLTGLGMYKDEEIVPDGHTIIMIEGIHALNPLISKLIPEKNKYKVYISALNQVNLDSHNRVSTTDGRLIRRSVRDHNFRGYSIEETFKMWDNIGKAEEKYIFPFQEKADALISSSLPYESAVLKKHIVPMLETIEEDSEYYSEARNVLETLKYVVSIDDDKLVSSESLLREFIGD
ncbi:nucleoside kinase [Neofamilia massiliensis]|uniref:nucleoside kinase n=1 Tax=Neofamilia massiliensis TaxID=1673724 RepID=UPI0006BB5691|nr:nucleoside kinase [Neofamilia massiliensis]